jgi:acyl-CoA thioester hydrolase
MRVKSYFMARYVETDQMGIVHHSNYVNWFEIGRFDFLRELGISNKEIENLGILLPLYEMNCQYKSPARAEDKIVVTTKLVDCSRVRIKFSYQVNDFNTNLLVALGETMHAWTDKDLRPINIQKQSPNVYNLCVSVIDH